MRARIRKIKLNCPRSLAVLSIHHGYHRDLGFLTCIKKNKEPFAADSGDLDSFWFQLCHREDSPHLSAAHKAWQAAGQGLCLTLDVALKAAEPTSVSGHVMPPK